MTRFMLVTFGLLGWAFFELSGGSDFEPPELASSPLNELQQSVEFERTLVARADTSPAQQPVVQTQSNDLVQNASVVIEDASTDAQPTASLAVVLGEAARETTPEPVIAEVPAADIRLVAGSRVNVRNGPGTNFSVVAQLTRGAETEVLQSPGNGWVKIRAANTGGVGWMAERLLTAQN
ncbi:SH3 domain-containing protein [Shimia ponticola]|uniref:SH3 domain-containing protein n=1 Tax=Shimia ponticola TaxID=2582893 RepID=UPI0011BF380F|nr:SH3 domain-containing protein [Shimia ponticola]